MVMHYVTIFITLLVHVDTVIYTDLSLSLSLSLSLHFNGHFPGMPELAGTRMSPFWILLELRVTADVARWRSSRVPDLRSIGRGFESQPPRCRVQPWASR